MTKMLSVWRENGNWMRLATSTSASGLVVEMFDASRCKWEFHEYVVLDEDDLTSGGIGA